MQSKHNESNIEEKGHSALFCIEKEFGREKFVIDSLQYHEFQLWRCLFTDKTNSLLSVT